MFWGTLKDQEHYVLKMGRLHKTHIDVAGHNGHVLEIQSGVYLIHEVQGRGLKVVQRKDQSQRAQSLLSSRQVIDFLPALLGRTHTEKGEEFISGIFSQLIIFPFKKKEKTL